jgi:hypothetical protein
MPKRRAGRVTEARQALADKSLPKAKLPDTKYSRETADEIIWLITDGEAIEDTVVGDGVIKKGIGSLVGVSPRTIYRWQKEKQDFALEVELARQESSHRLADRIRSLADVALDQPNMANAVRVAVDALKWSAMVRNRAHYGDKSEVALKADGGPLINIHLAALGSMSDIIQRAVTEPNPVNGEDIA